MLLLSSLLSFVAQEIQKRAGYSASRLEDGLGALPDALRVTLEKIKSKLLRCGRVGD